MLKKIFAILFIPFCIGGTITLISIVKDFLQLSFQAKVFLTGMLFYTLFRWYTHKNWSSHGEKFHEVFEHELTHTIFAYIFRSDISKFKATTTEGGYIEHTHSNFIVSLAPYFFPTYTAFVLLIYPIIKEQFNPIFVFLAGFTFAYHLISTYYEFGFHQTDITKTGKFFSVVFIYLMNVLFVSLILTIVLKGYGGIPAFGKMWLNNTMNFFKTIKIL